MANTKITSRVIADDAVTTAAIADDAVVAASIADDAITETKINKTAISSQSEVTAATGDYLLVGDASASNSLKKTPISSVLDLNDTSVLENNIALLGFYRASDNAASKYNLVDQVIDEYQDATGIDASASTDEVLGGSGSLKYYSGATSSTGSTVTTTYTYDGTDDTITLNNGESIAGTIMAWGGGGGADSAGSGKHGGGGGYVTGTLAYTSDGTDLIVSVGQGGMMGTKGGSGGAGGGYSGVFLGSKAHGNSVIVAAGAGGAGDGYDGAAGGGTTGGSAGSTGGGGTQSAGGAVSTGSSIYSQPAAGSTLQGGVAGSEQDPVANAGQSGSFNGGGMGGSEPGGKMSGGGGGGGYYGGGGGHANTGGYGGGGGSSYHNSTYISSATNTSGGANAPGYTGTNYPSGVGTSALSSAGGNGAVWISYAITAPTGANMVLQSTDTTAETTPTTGDIVMLIENATGTATLNTDIKAFISRDSGANFTQGTLVDEGSWGTNKKILAFHGLDISGQPSGTSMCYKITMHNQDANKITRVHATSFAWA